MAKAHDNRIETRVNVILLLLTGWMGAGVISIWAMVLRKEPTPGIGNTDMAIGWQAIGAILGFAVWGIALGLPKTNGIRRMSLVPLGLSLAAIALVLLLAG